MQLQYIEENLNLIVQNSDNVMYLRPYDIGRKRALFAVVKEEEGVYKKVQITKAQSKGNFPFEPILWFYQGPGYFYLKDFIVFDNWLALNITNLEGFKHKTLEESKIFKVGVFATFNDGSATFVKRQTPKDFEKKGGIQAYIDLLKQHKEYEPKYETYKYIEGYSYNGDTFIIPELQEKKEKDKSSDSILDNLGRKSVENIINDPTPFPDGVYRPNYYAFTSDKEEKQEKGYSLVKRRKHPNPTDKK